MEFLNKDGNFTMGAKIALRAVLDLAGFDKDAAAESVQAAYKHAAEMVAKISADQQTILSQQAEILALLKGGAGNVQPANLEAKE